MQAKEIMSRNVECMAPETGIIDAAKRMKSLDVGFLGVCENDRIAGAVTDRDIVIRAVAEGKILNQCKVRDVMTKDAFWCFEDQSIDEVAEFMAKKEIRRVLILNHDKRLVGVVSLGDLAKTKDKKAGQAMKEIVEAPSAAA